MGRSYLVNMSGDGSDPAGNHRYASERTKRRKALKVKPTARGGPKKNDNHDFHDRVGRERMAQGLPARIEDPATLARVAQLLRFEGTEKPAKTREVIRWQPTQD